MASAILQPLGRIANRILVKLEAETDKRLPGCEVRTGKVPAFETRNMISETYPGIPHQIVFMTARYMGDIRVDR